MSLTKRGVASDAATIAPNDNLDVSDQLVGLYVGGTGAVTCLMSSGRSVLFAAVPAGTVLPVAVRRVMATGTTATSIVGLLHP